MLLLYILSSKHSLLTLIMNPNPGQHATFTPCQLGHATLTPCQLGHANWDDWLLHGHVIQDVVTLRMNTVAPICMQLPDSMLGRMFSGSLSSRKDDQVGGTRI